MRCNMEKDILEEIYNICNEIFIRKPAFSLGIKQLRMNATYLSYGFCLVLSIKDFKERVLLLKIIYTKGIHYG